VSVTLERKLARRRLELRLDDILPLELSKQTPRLSVTPAPIGKYGLWHVKGMQFPPYFQNVRNALMRNGHSVAEASAITWKAIRSWARGQKTGGERGKIHPEVRAAARKALAGIAADSARAHAQRVAHAHANVIDYLVLREFARSGRVLELANPYHSSSGQFTSPGNQGSAQPKQKNVPPTNQQKNPPKPISPKQRQQYLQQAAADQARAAMLRQEAAKINQQIAALTALIAVQQKFLATSASGATNANAGTQTNKAAGAQTKNAAAGTQTAKATTGTTAPSTASATANYNVPATKQMLASNQAQLKQLTAKRNQLMLQAQQLDQQAQTYLQLANG
jgi:hypothetical protein